MIIDASHDAADDVCGSQQCSARHQPNARGEACPRSMILHNSRNRRLGPIASDLTQLGAPLRRVPISRACEFDGGPPVDCYCTGQCLGVELLCPRAAPTCPTTLIRCRFGAAQVVRSDGLCVDGTSPLPTFVANLTLLIYAVSGAIANLHHASNRTLKAPDT